MDRRLESIDRKLDAKANQSDLVLLAGRVEAIEAWRQVELERDRQSDQKFSRREKVLALFFALLAVVVQFFTHFHFGGH